MIDRPQAASNLPLNSYSPKKFRNRDQKAENSCSIRKSAFLGWFLESRSPQGEEECEGLSSLHRLGGIQSCALGRDVPHTRRTLDLGSELTWVLTQDEGPGSQAIHGNGSDAMGWGRFRGSRTQFIPRGMSILIIRRKHAGFSGLRGRPVKAPEILATTENHS